MPQKHVSDDSQSDYRTIRNQAAKAMHRGVWTDRFEPRFVPLSTRDMRSDIPSDVVGSISRGKHYVSYRGVPMAKDPFDMVIYEILLYELQPRTVIELGAYTGASALWMADTLRTSDIPAHVFSLDIDLTLVDELARRSSDVTFLEGDCNQIEQVLPANRLAELPHPIVLVDDAHVNISAVYRHFDAHALRSGDYLIVEDTIPDIPGKFGQSDTDEKWGDWKWHEIRGFFDAHADQYMLDRYYTDFFGYNATWNWNGFFKKV